MALVLKDRVKGWTDSYGEDNFVIFATTNGYQSFSVIGNGNQTYYTVFDPTNYDWEVGIGTYTAATTTLSRDTILSSSNNNLIVSFLPGTKELFVGYPAEKAVTLDTPQTLTDKTLVNATVTSGTVNNTTIGATTPASGAFTTLVASGASLTSVNAGVALLTSATVTTLNATGASIASANIGNLQFTAASIASINAGVAVITNLSATSASIASMNAGVALLTTATVTTLNATGASIASANIGNLQFTAASIASINAGVAVITNLTATGASIASANVGTAVITTGTVTNLTSTSASVASINAAVALITTGTVAALTATGASVASANVGTAVVTGLTVTNASIASLNAGTATVTTGNLTFSSTGQRITGDFSGVNSARVYFQTSTTNGATALSAMPNGTGTQTGLYLYAESDLTNNSFTAIRALSGTDMRLQSGITGTGTYLPMTFYTGGSERMRLDTSGNLGIGTASPGSFYSEARNLVVGTGTGGQGMTIYAGTASQSRLMFADGTTGSDPYTGFVQYDHSSNALAFGTNGGTERMRIDSSGNVGIGTASPSAPLEVLGTATAVRATSGQLWLNRSNSTTQYEGICFRTGPARDAFIGRPPNSDDIIFGFDGGSALSESMRLTIAGKLLIGATTARYDESFFAPGYAIIGALTGGVGQIIIGNDGTTGINGTVDNVAYVFRTNNTERMRIDNSGNVSIGTTASTLAGSTFKTIINYAGGGVFGLNNSNNTNQSWGILIGDSGAGGAGRFNIVQNVNGSTGGYGGGPCVPIIAADPPTTANTTPRLLINSSGDVLVATTSNSATANVGVKIALTDASNPLVRNVVQDSSGTYSTYTLYSTNAGAYRFYVTTAGVINATTTTITGISDERLKENIRDLDAGLNEILSVKPRRFDWKAGKGQDKKDAVGFIAQEFEQVFPNSVSKSLAGADGIEYKTLCHEELIPAMVKAIQELSAKVAALEAK